MAPAPYNIAINDWRELNENDTRKTERHVAKISWIIFDLVWGNFFSVESEPVNRRKLIKFEKKDIIVSPVEKS